MSASYRTPSAVPIRWEVRKKDGTLLGEVTARLWFDARAEACQLYGVDRGDIEVAPLLFGVVGEEVNHGGQ